jgi:hypothetical protein
MILLQRFPESDSGTPAVLRDELDSGAFKRCPDSSNIVAKTGSYSFRGLHTAQCGHRNARCKRKFFLSYTCKCSTRGDLTTRDLSYFAHFDRNRLTIFRI